MSICTRVSAINVNSQHYQRVKQSESRHGKLPREFSAMYYWLYRVPQSYRRMIWLWFARVTVVIITVIMVLGVAAFLASADTDLAIVGVCFLMAMAFLACTAVLVWAGDRIWTSSVYLKICNSLEEWWSRHRCTVTISD